MSQGEGSGAQGLGRALHDRGHNREPCGGDDGPGERRGPRTGDDSLPDVWVFVEDEVTARQLGGAPGH
jgi:hypothetical protein